MALFSARRRHEKLGLKSIRQIEECSFFQKRTKKLLPASGNTESACLASSLRAMSKSFLFVFSKKKFFPLPNIK